MARRGAHGRRRRGARATSRRRSSCEVWRYRVSLIDVVVPARRRPKTKARIHRCANLDPRDVTVFKGIPVTTVARPLVDLTDELTKWELANVIHEADVPRPLSTSPPRGTAWRARTAAGTSNGSTKRSRCTRTAAPARAAAASSASSPRSSEPGSRAAREHAPQRLGGRLPLAGPAPRDRARRPRSRARAPRREDATKEAAWRAGGFEVLRFKEASCGRPRMPWPPARAVAYGSVVLSVKRQRLAVRTGAQRRRVRLMRCG